MPVSDAQKRAADKYRRENVKRFGAVPIQLVIKQRSGVRQREGSHRRLGFES